MPEKSRGADFLTASKAETKTIENYYLEAKARALEFFDQGEFFYAYATVYDIALKNPTLTTEQRKYLESLRRVQSVSGDKNRLIALIHELRDRGLFETAVGQYKHLIDNHSPEDKEGPSDVKTESEVRMQARELCEFLYGHVLSEVEQQILKEANYFSASIISQKALNDFTSTLDVSGGMMGSLAARAYDETRSSAYPTPELNRVLSNHSNQPPLQVLGALNALKKEEIRLSRQENAIALDELIQFCKSKSLTEADPEKLVQFLEQIQEVYFSGHPNFGSNIATVELLVLTAKANRIPEVQGYFGQTLVGNLDYNLQFFSDVSVERLMEKMHVLPLEDVLDVLHQCQTVAASSASEGWARGALQKLFSFVEQLKIEHPSELVQYTAASVLKRMESEAKNPSLEVIKRRGDRAEGRLYETLSAQEHAENLKLKRQIQSDIPLHESDRLVRVANDAVAIVDHSGTPRHIGHIDQASLPAVTEADISSSDLEVAFQYANPEVLSSQRGVEGAMQHINSTIISRRVDGDVSSLKFYAKEWSRISSVLTPSQWEAFYQSIDTMNAAAQHYEEVRVQEQQQTENFNEAFSEVYVHTFSKLAPKIIAGCQGVRRAQLQRTYDEFKGVYQINPEAAFAAVEDFTRLFKMLEQGFLPYGNREVATTKEARKHINTLLSLSNRINEIHSAAWEEATQQVQEAYPIHTDSYKRAQWEYMRCVLQLKNNAERVSQELHHYVSEKDREIHFSPQEVKFTSYESIVANPELSPFGAVEGIGDMGLLLQDLHRCRKDIEQDLGIEFSQIPYRSEMHFLLYLVRKHQSQDWARTKTVLQSMDSGASLKNKVLETFIASAENVGYGDMVIKLVENIPNPSQLELILDKYLELARTTAHMDSELQSVFAGDTNELVVRTAMQQLLHEANELLVGVSVKASTGNVGQIMTNLTSINARARTVVAAVRARKAHGEQVDLQEILSFKKIELSGPDLQDMHPKLVSAMRKLYVENYSTRYKTGTADDSKVDKVIQQLLAGFNEALNNPKSKFYVYVDEQNIDSETGEPALVSFCRFDQGYDEAGQSILHAAAANTNPDYKNADMGKVAMAEAFTREGEQGVPIIAEVAADNPLAEFYLENLGFVIVGSFPLEGGRSLGLALKMRIDKSLSARLPSRRLDKAYLQLIGDGGQFANFKMHITTTPDFRKLTEGYVLSRLFTGADGKKYYVFEVPAAEVSEFAAAA